MNWTTVLGGGGFAAVLLAVINGVFNRGSVLTRAAEDMQKNYAKTLDDLREENARINAQSARVSEQYNRILHDNQEMRDDNAQMRAELANLAGIVRDYRTTLLIHGAWDREMMQQYRELADDAGLSPTPIVAPPLTPPSAEAFENQDRAPRNPPTRHAEEPS